MLQAEESEHTCEEKREEVNEASSAPALRKLLVVWIPRVPSFSEKLPLRVRSMWGEDEVSLFYRCSDFTNLLSLFLKRLRWLRMAA